MCSAATGQRFMRNEEKRFLGGGLYHYIDFSGGEFGWLGLVTFVKTVTFTVEN